MPEEQTEDTKRDKIIEAIFDALPANSYKEIASKVTREMRCRIKPTDINNALAHLRRNSAEYGWVVPHVKRGKPMAGQTRYFSLLVDRDGHYELDENPEFMVHLKGGASGTIHQVSTMMKNLASAITVAATHTRSRIARDQLNDFAADFAYISRKAVAVARDLDQEAEAA